MPAQANRGILGFFIHHRNAANLLMVMLLLFGAFALMRINTQFFPTVDTPTITVSITWSGASAEDVESNILGGHRAEPAVPRQPRRDALLRPRGGRRP